MAVWKIGSRWGENGNSVLDLFLNYECVFFGECNGGNIGNWREVKPGDFFIISDGATPVAIGKSTGTFNAYKDSGFDFAKKHKEEVIYSDDDVAICPANIVLLPKESRNDICGIDPRRRFCRYHSFDTNIHDKVASIWDELSSKQNKNFEIIPRAVSLFKGEKPIFDKESYYRIPKYQRPYSWGEDELRGLIESLRDALSVTEAIFMGTIQLSAPIPLSIDNSKFAYNVIDGQQRITTFIILINVLEEKLNPEEKLNIQHTIPVKEKLQSWVSRGEEQLKLERYLDAIGNSPLTNSNKDENNRYLLNHNLIGKLLDEYFANEDEETNESKCDQCPLQKLYEFIKGDAIKFVVIETHAGLSKTLRIFNTINTSGLALGTDDVFKIRFYEYLVSAD